MNLYTTLLGKRVKYPVHPNPIDQPLKEGTVVAVWLDARPGVTSDALTVAISSGPGMLLDIRQARSVMLVADPPRCEDCGRPTNPDGTCTRPACCNAD